MRVTKDDGARFTVGQRLQISQQINDSRYLALPVTYFKIKDQLTSFKRISLFSHELAVLAPSSVVKSELPG